MTKKTTEALQAAIERLGAVEVAPGFAALKGAHSGKWRVLELAEVSPGYTPTALTFQVSGKLMPSWWSPGRQISTRMRDEIQGDEHVIYREIFTADLATGLAT